MAFSIYCYRIVLIHLVEADSSRKAKKINLQKIPTTD